jgi:hypothetical protein
MKFVLNEENIPIIMEIRILYDNKFQVKSKEAKGLFEVFELLDECNIKDYDDMIRVVQCFDIYVNITNHEVYLNDASTFIYHCENAAYLIQVLIEKLIKRLEKIEPEHDEYQEIKDKLNDYKDRYDFLARLGKF